MLVSCLVLVSLLSSPALSSPARVIKQRVPKFKNFPIVGLKKTVTEDVELESKNQPAVDEHPRDPRGVDPQQGPVRTVYSEEPVPEDLFVEEALYLTPADREERALEQLSQGETFDDLFDDVSLAGDDSERQERDGAHHHAPSHRAGRRGQRGGRQNQRARPVQLEAEYDYDYQEPEPVHRQEQRGGRQTGGTGVALGVLSNPPSSDGNYNFK